MKIVNKIACELPMSELGHCGLLKNVAYEIKSSVYLND